MTPMFTASGSVVAQRSIKGAAAELGRLGGKAKSQLKAQAARRNGRKGGRRKLT